MVFDKLGFCTKPPKLVAQDPRRILKDPHNYSEGSSRIRRRILKDLAGFSDIDTSQSVSAFSCVKSFELPTHPDQGDRNSFVSFSTLPPNPDQIQFTNLHHQRLRCIAAVTHALCTDFMSAQSAGPASRKASKKLHPKPITTIGQRLASHLPIPGYNPGPQSSHVASRL